METKRPGGTHNASDRFFWLRTFAGCLSPIILLFSGGFALMLISELITDYEGNLGETVRGIVVTVLMFGPLVAVGVGLGLFAHPSTPTKKSGVESGGGFPPLDWLRRFRAPTDAEWEAIPKHPGMRYQEYLQTDAWRRKSDFMKARFGNRCQLCNRRGNLNTHHRTYERVGEERMEDLTVLCRDCHERFHRTH